MYQAKRNFYSTTMLSFMLSVREGEDGGGAGGSGGGTDDFQKKLDEAVAQAVSGLKAKNEELLGKNAQYREQVKQFEGLDPEQLKALKAKLDADEDTKLFSEGKKEMVIEKYTQRMRDQHKAELAQIEERVKAEAARADTYKGAVLDNHIRSVCVGMHPSAVEDALLHARNIFSLDPKGRAVQLDSEGRPVLGKDGSNPFSPAEWIESQKELKPHWFPSTSSGSGSGGTSGAGAGAGKTISRSAFEKLSAAQQSEAARSGVQIVS